MDLVSGTREMSMQFHYSVKKGDSHHIGMLCVKIGKNWSSGSGEDENLKR